jgi:hypothetical protein
MPDSTPRYTSSPVSVASKALGGGLNTTAGPLHLEDNECSDLQNTDFDKFGSILKRNGYTAINTAKIGSGVKSDGMKWYEYDNAGTTTRLMVNATDGKLYTMPESMSGVWTDKTGTGVFTAGYRNDYETFRGRLFGTNGVDKPWMLDASGNAQPIPGLLANSYTFGVNSITTAPAVGDTYTNNAITYTIAYVNISGTAGAKGGYIVATGSGAPTISGTLVRTAGAGDANIAFTISNANVNITKAKFVSQYNNYLFLANVTTGDGVNRPTRMYWCDINNPESWLGTSWIEVSYLDGQEITQLWGFSNYLFIFKTRSIFGCTFTGDADFPFILPGGGRSSSAIGCVAPWSMAQIEEGVIFVSYDGIYLFDGTTSYKLTDKIRDTFLGLNVPNFKQVESTINRKKNMVYFAFPSGATNDTILCWNYFLNAWSVYKGLAPAAMETAYVGGVDERPCFADYGGFVYRMDSGPDDYPLNVRTAIDGYFWTNWKTMDDLVNKKGIPEVVVYYAQSESTLTFAYAYDFTVGEQFSSTFRTIPADAFLWGSGLWGVDNWTGATGGGVIRRDLTGRGRVVRFKIANNTVGETFRIDGFGSLAQLDTNV